MFSIADIHGANHKCRMVFFEAKGTGITKLAEESIVESIVESIRRSPNAD